MTIDPRSWARVPSHVLVMLGASTAGYALVLAGVAGLQSRTEADLAAARSPALEGLAGLQRGHDALVRRLDAARTEYSETVEAYLAAGGALDALHEQVGSLATVVAEIDGVSRSLPTSVKLPVVRRSVVSVSVPSTQATTGASGG